MLGELLLLLHSIRTSPELLAPIFLFVWPFLCWGMTRSRFAVQQKRQHMKRCHGDKNPPTGKRKHKLEGMSQRGEPSSAYHQGLNIGTGSGVAPQFRIDEPEFQIALPNNSTPLQGDWRGRGSLIYWLLTLAIAARLQTENVLGLGSEASQGPLKCLSKRPPSGSRYNIPRAVQLSSSCTWYLPVPSSDDGKWHRSFGINL
jgi:hypothetical protein